MREDSDFTPAGDYDPGWREAARKQYSPVRLVGGFNMTCSKCSRSFSSSRDYLTHVQTGYPCGPVAR
jgi:hypothetical protein